MRKEFFVLILILFFLPCCKNQMESSKGNSQSTIAQDSIINIVEKLCSQWEINDDLKQSYNSKGIGVGNMVIECIVIIDNNQLLNELFIFKNPGLSRIDAIIPKNIDSLFLPAGDSVTISKRKKYYGFEYHNLEAKRFIAIKELNDSLLILVDGRKFQRKK